MIFQRHAPLIGNGPGQVAVIVGAQTGETRVPARAGLTLASAAKASPVAREGAFGTCLLSGEGSGGNSSFLALPAAG